MSIENELRARIRKLEIEAEIAEKRFDNLFKLAIVVSDIIVAADSECPDAPDDECYCAEERCGFCALMRANAEAMMAGYLCRFTVQEIEEVVEAAVIGAKCYFSGQVRVAVRGGESLGPCDRKWFERDGCVWVVDDEGERKLDRLQVGEAN